MITIKIISHSGKFIDDANQEHLRKIFSNSIKASVLKVECKAYDSTKGGDAIAFTLSHLNNKESNIVFLEANLGVSGKDEIPFSEQFFQSYKDSKFILYSATVVNGKPLGTTYIGKVKNVIGALNKPLNPDKIKTTLFTEEIINWMKEKGVKEEDIDEEFAGTEDINGAKGVNKINKTKELKAKPKN